MDTDERLKVLTREELDNIECYDYHSPAFNFPLYAAILKEALIKETGCNVYFDKGLNFHLEHRKEDIDGSIRDIYKDV